MVARGTHGCPGVYPGCTVVAARAAGTARQLELTGVSARGAHFWNNTFRDLGPELVVWSALRPDRAVIRLRELFISQELAHDHGRQAGLAGLAGPAQSGRSIRFGRFD